MKKLGSLIAVLVLAAVAAVGLAACGGGDDETSGGGSGKQGGILKGTYASFPDYMDPALSYTAEGWSAKTAKHSWLGEAIDAPSDSVDAAYASTRGRRCWWVSGFARAMFAPIDASSACAVSSVTPSLSRPNM